MLKELGASKKISTIIEGESLLNDGTAMVAYLVVYVSFVTFTLFPGILYGRVTHSRQNCRQVLPVVVRRTLSWNTYGCSAILVDEANPQRSDS